MVSSGVRHGCGQRVYSPSTRCPWSLHGLIAWSWLRAWVRTAFVAAVETISTTVGDVHTNS